MEKAFKSQNSLDNRIGSIFNPALRRDAGFERVFDHLHLGHGKLIGI